jgi:hypothetical protein
MKLLKPIEINISDIEELIIEKYTDINKRYSNKSFELAERILVFFHFISSGIISNRRNYFFDNSSICYDNINWVQIPSFILKLIFGYSNQSKISYTQILNDISHIIATKKISINDQVLDFYIVGKKCKEYTFKCITSFDYYKIKSKPVVLLFEKMNKILLQNNVLSEYENLLRYNVSINTSRIIIDDNEDVEGILSDYLTPQLTPKKFIEFFNENLFNTSVDSFGLRLHTKITTLKKDLHPYLSVDGERLKIIDIPNSQPFFSSIITSEIMSKLFHNKAWQFINQVIDIYKKYESNSDFIRYKELCATAGLYEYIRESYNLSSKNEAKKLFFTIAFSNYSNIKWKEKKENLLKFEYLFPSVFKCFYELKTIKFNCREIKKGDYTNNCLLYQRAESFFIYHFVAPKLIANNIFFSTIHDSIVCKATDEGIVKKIFSDTFTELGIQPPIF